MYVNFFYILLLLLCFNFAVQAQQIDTVYNANGTYEVGEVRNGKKYGAWQVYGTSFYLYQKIYEGDYAYVTIYEYRDQLHSSYRLRIFNNQEELKDGEYKYFFNGKLSVTGGYVEGERLGKWTYFDSQGDIDRIGIYTFGSDTIFCIEYSKGVIAEFGNYMLNNGKIGYWTELHRNGRIKSYGEFSGGFRTVEKRVAENVFGSEIIYNKNGVWLYWDEAGAFIKQEYFWNGNKID